MVARAASEENRVIVLGAGIVGLCVAYSLAKAGLDVTVIDPQPPASQCSAGNAGAISSRAVAPLAMPGLLKSVPGMLLDPTGPLYIPRSYILSVAPWLFRFIAASRPERVNQIAQGLNALHEDAVALHQQLAQEVGCRERIRTNGQLHLYPDRQALDKDRRSWALKASYGLVIEEVDRAGILALEPHIGDAYNVGLFLPDQAWVSEPRQYALCIAEAARARGVQFIQAAAEHIGRQGLDWRIDCAGTSLTARHIVLAAGAWSGRLLGALGVKVPLESQRGYHVQLHGDDAPISRQVVLADRKVFVSPLESGLRIAGTVEFGGFSRPPSEKRAQLLLEHAQAGIPALRRPAQADTWMGHRPCLPDSLPVIGAVPSLRGMWCAFGHGHLGVTGSARTGQWLAEAIRGDMHHDRLKPYEVARFA
ncbi:FAD-dependent oxidoreductase [Burkholderia sp. Ac-20365]|uniref:NAD(P)/FAD-dependent oxidoreductase n=1 Tax=Burkholderia sp. Ac-20365 TaxID=2703897 RepID=UPI00197B4489|nr:FAD-dependent oxidoreductase [Burkholderia sp. Ac-20365]MBN3766173.1 FAD-dependent oxidoreductase [Burkholderia sp. Ac-20365]